jgi:hypothetical protein
MRHFVGISQSLAPIISEYLREICFPIPGFICEIKLLEAMALAHRTQVLKRLKSSQG